MDTLKELFNAINTPIALINQNHEFEYVNELFGSFTNYRVNELIGKNVFDCTSMLWPPNFKTKLDACLKGQKQDIEVSSDTRLPFSIKLRPHSSLQDDSNAAFLTINSTPEINDCPQGENYIQLINALPNSLFILQHGRIQLVNPSLCRLSEYSEKELLDQDYTQFIAPEELSKIQEIHKNRTLGKDAPLSYESIATTKSGKQIPVKTTIVPITFNRQAAWQVVMQDISAYKTTLNKLADSEEKYRFLSETTLDAIFIHKNGVVLECNQALHSITGYTREETIGANLFDLVLSNKELLFIQNQVAKEHAKPYLFDIRKKDGSIFKGEIEGHETVYKGEEVRLVTLKDVTERIANEKAITESEAKMRAIFENKGTATFIINEKDKVIMANKQCEVITGYSLDVLEKGEGISWDFFTHPDDVKQVKLNNEARLKGKEIAPKSYEARVMHKSGKTHYVLLSVEVIPGTSETVVSLVDINDRILAEQKLKDNSKLLRSFIDNLPDDAWTKDLKGRVTMVNRFAKENTLGNRDVIGKTAHEFFPKEIADAFWESEKQVLVNKQKLVAEELVRTVHGIRSKIVTKFPLFNAEGEITGLGAIAHDITKRKEAEKKLKEQKDFLWLLIDNMPNQIFWKDKNLVYQGCNKTFADVVGLASPKEVKGKTDFDFVRETEYSSDYQEWDKKVLEKGEAIYNIEEPYYNADGNEGIVLTYKMPLFDEQKQVNGVLGFNVDISQMKKAENEAKRSANFAHALLNSLSIPTYYKNIEGEYIGCNKAFEEFHGKTVNELIGKRVDEVWEYKWAQLKREKDKETLKNLKRQGFEFDLLNKNGEEKRVIYSENIIYDENNEAAGLIGSFLDITHRLQEEKLKTAQLELIEKSVTHTVSEILESFLNEAEKLSNSQIGFYHFISDDQDTILLQEWSTNTAHNYCNANVEDKHYSISKAGVWVDCIKKGKPVVHNDYVNLKHKKGLPKGHAPLIRELVVPVIRGEKVKAILGVGNKPSEYTDEDVNIIQQLADFAWELIERKVAQEELLKSEEKFKSYVENAPFGVFVADEKGNYVEVNPSASTITGYTNEELLNLRVPKILDEQSLATSMKGFFDMVNKDKPVNTDEFYKHKSGEVRQWHINAVKLSATRYLGFVYDITEKNEYLKQLKESEKRYRNLFQSTPISLWEEDLSEVLVFLNQLKKQGIEINEAYFKTHPEILQSCISKIKIIDINETTLKNHKASSKKQLYQKLPELFTDISINSMAKWLTDIANGETSFITESQTVTLQGEVRDTLMKAHLDKQSGLIILAEIDTTEQKKAELEIKKYQNHLEDLVKQRTEALETSHQEMETFSYSVSHDLRAPLRAINGFAGYLEKDYAKVLDSEGKRYLNIIKDNSVKMDQLISDLLKLSRTSRAELEFVLLNMKAIANSMYMEVASEKERETFEFVIHDLPEISGDITSIKQLWTNLIGNAVKYSSKSATKRIEIGTATVSNESVTYYVKDWGCGFNEEYEEKLFEIFQRLHSDKEYSGSGVGLALVKRIIDKHKGEIWAESEEQMGAAFYFSLPIKQNKYHDE